MTQTHDVYAEYPSIRFSGRLQDTFLVKIEMKEKINRNICIFLRSRGTKAQMKQSWYIMLNSLHLRRNHSPLIFTSRREHFPDRRRLLVTTTATVLLLLTPDVGLGKSFGLTVSPFCT